MCQLTGSDVTAGLVIHKMSQCLIKIIGSAVMQACYLRGHDLYGDDIITMVLFKTKKFWLLEHSRNNTFDFCKITRHALNEIKNKVHQVPHCIK